MKSIWGLHLYRASEPNDKFSGGLRTYGTGVGSCGKFAADYRQNPDQVDNLFFTWAQGFMSGFNITEATGTYRDMTAVPIDAQKVF